MVCLGTPHRKEPVGEVGGLLLPSSIEVGRTPGEAHVLGEAKGNDLRPEGRVNDARVDNLRPCTLWDHREALAPISWKVCVSQPCLLGQQWNRELTGKDDSKSTKQSIYPSDIPKHMIHRFKHVAMLHWCLIPDDQFDQSEEIC